MPTRELVETKGFEKQQSFRKNKKFRDKQLFVRNKVSRTEFVVRSVALEFATRASVEKTGNELSSGSSVEEPVVGVCVGRRAVQKLHESSSRSAGRGPA